MAEDITPDTLPGADANVPASDGNGTADAPAAKQLKDVLGAALGKEFKDDQTALKAVKDTFNYVGRAGKYEKAVAAVRQRYSLANDEAAIARIMADANPSDAAQPSVPAAQQPDISKEVAELKATIAEREFYDQHPEYKAHRDLIRSLGSDPVKVTDSDVFKNTYEQLKVAAASASSKSVLHANPRLAQATDKMGAAKEAAKAGDHTAAKAAAMDALNDALSS